jgi:hypothetical protein
MFCLTDGRARVAYLVLSKQGNVQDDRQRGGVGSENDKLAGSTGERLGRLVGTLLQLAVVAALLDEVEELLRKSRVGLGPGSGFVLVSHCEDCRWLKVSLASG